MFTRLDWACRVLQLGVALTLLAGSSAWLAAQNDTLQQRLTDIEQLQSANKKKLAHYAWQETANIQVKGQLQGSVISRVRIAPDGTQQRTELEYWMPSATGGGLIQKTIGQDRKDDIKTSADSLEALTAEYTEAPPDLLHLTKDLGNVFMQPAGPGAFNVVIKNFLKTNDSVTFAVNGETEQMTAVKISSYLDDPEDTVSITARFAKLPDGTNH